MGGWEQVYVVNFETNTWILIVQLPPLFCYFVLIKNKKCKKKKKP
jgi:hypothetical protein